jgi:hypothetical protein
MERSSQVFWGLLDFIVIGFSPRFSIYGRANFVDMDGDEASTGMILES